MSTLPPRLQIPEQNGIMRSCRVPTWTWHGHFIIDQNVKLGRGLALLKVLTAILI